jgi:hypothetical protein
VTNPDGITDHIRAREEEHFRKKDRELIEKLRQADAAAKARRALEQEADLHDPEMLRELDLMGFTPETIALLPLVPVLQVAWAKAGVSSAERTLIVNLARSRGIAANSAADRTLNEWLEHKPSEDTFHKATRHAFAYVFAGSGVFHNASQPLPVKTDNTGDLDAAVYREAGDRSLVLFDRGDDVTVQAGEMGIRFLLVSGKPLEEPVAWHGPVVMNTEEELRQAFREIREGTFIK